jgi:hypothetical protein
MSIGSSAGAGDVLRVDPEMLSQLGSQLQTSAGALPDAPAPFTVTGADAISQAIAAKLPGLETPIIEGLPAVKEAAGQTASNIVTAAGMYQTTDEQIAAEYEKHQFDGSGAGGGSGGGMGAGGAASGAGGALGDASSAAGAATGSGGDAMGQMSQMMGTPMQMASQAAQMPMQAMGAVSSLPQGAMQGVQQISQMAGGMGKGEGGPGSGSGSGSGTGTGDAPVGAPSEEARSDERAAAERAAAERQVAGSEERRERVPGSAVGQAPQTDSAVPNSTGPRHAAPHPAIDV